MLPILILGFLLLTIALPYGWYRWALKRRQAALTRLLDLADAVEALLDRSQKSMVALQSLVGRVPADIGAVAQASLTSALPIREAKRDVLQHRLWIAKNGGTAALRELDTACTALERVRQRLSLQLTDLEKAGSDLAKATDTVAASARREPATLRRDQEV